MTVLLLIGLAMLLRRPHGREEDRLLTLADGVAGLGSAFELPRDAGALPASQRKELRDALGPPAQASEALKLRPMQADWNAIWGDGTSPLTVARMDASGRVQVAHGDAYEPPKLRPRAAVAARATRPRPRAAAPPAAAGPSAAPRAPRAPRRTKDASRTTAAASLETDEDELDADEEGDAADGETLARADNRLGARILSWFSAAESKRKERQRKLLAKLRKTLKALLGKGILRPPQGNPKPPSFGGLGPLPPAPDGAPLLFERFGPEDLERLSPPDDEKGYRGWYRDGRAKPHWHAGQRGQYFHRSSDWGLAAGEKWAWMLHAGDKWWTEGGKTPLVWHGEHWWWRQEDGWFLLHDGQAWAYRFFEDLKHDGLFDPKSRARVIYSEDARRVAIQIPGHDTIVYDVATHEELGRIPQEPDRARRR